MRRVQQPRLAAARQQHAHMRVQKFPIIDMRHRCSVSSMVLWLGILTMVAPHPAAAGWGPRSFLTGFAVYSGPISGSVKSLMIQNHSSIAIGSSLHALDQCGGEGGLCNATTIGIPCGDHPWGGVYCPDNFECKRQNASWWICMLLPGRKPGEEERQWMQAHAPKAANKTSKAKSTSKHGRDSSSSRQNVESADRDSNYRRPETEQGPIVPVCGPAQLAGRGTAMCNRSVDGFFVNPAPADATSGAGFTVVGASKCMVAVLLRFVAATLAATAVHLLAGS